MKRRLILMWLCTVFYGAIWGQSSLKGRVRDTAFSKDCALSVVALLQPDSTLVEYTRSRKDGGFIFHNITPGFYKLLISHPAYSNYSTSLQIYPDSSIDMGIIALPPKSDTLTPVIVSPRSLGPHMRGDTLEYNTAHIKTRINATVEELLTRLPGVQVDQNGNITVNGQKIEKLLVDGKDFFGGSPTMATRNLNADMIEKAQILDKKSKQAEFTGVDEGQRTKTLNLVLKEDSKRGTLLKTEAGGSTQGYHEISGLVGSFAGDRQMAVIGMAANTGSTVFNGSLDALQANISLGSDVSDALGASAGVGIPDVAGAGLYYANQWNGNQNNIVGNYRYGRLTVNPFSQSIVRQTLPDSIYLQQQRSASHNTQEEHFLNFQYGYVPDTIYTFNFYVGGTNAKGKNDLMATGSSSFNDTLVNSSSRSIQSDVMNQNVYGGIMLQRRAKKKIGRVFSFTSNMTRQDNSTNGFLYSLNNFYQPDGKFLRSDTTDQRKEISSLDNTLTNSLNYTEPLGKVSMLALSYALGYNTNESKQSTYGPGAGKYNVQVDSLSNHYKNNILTQHLLFDFSSHTKKIIYVIGGELLHYSNREADLLQDTSLRYRYLSFAPHINTRFTIRPGKGFNVDYNGSSQQPTILQLQPIKNNNDPLHITLGNPNLHASYTHHIAILYSCISQYTTVASLNAELITNVISSRTYTDSLGRQVSQTVNVNGAYNASFNFAFSGNIKSLDLNMVLSSTQNFQRSVNYINADLSKNNNYTSAWGISLNKAQPDKYRVYLNSNLSFLYSSSSINLAHPIHYWTQSQFMQVYIYGKHGIEFNTNLNYTWRQRLDDFDKNNSTLLLSAYIGKNFLKNQLFVRWQVNDILGQNAGISRSSVANQTSENIVNVLGRYWMLSASYRFVHHKRLN